MNSVYRFRKERHFAKPPEAIWPFIADSARINEMVGFPPYRVEERLGVDGRVRRIASGKLGPLRLNWEETFGEWQENRRVVQTRKFLNGPIGNFVACAELEPEGAGSRLVFSAEIECRGALGLLARLSGQVAREGERRIAAIERLIDEADGADNIPGRIAEPAIKPAARRRFDLLLNDLDRDPASHGLGRKLAAFLLHAPSLVLRSVRPLTMARLWRAAPGDAVDLFLAAQRLGIVAMEWDLLCPRCRGAKLRVRHLHELPDAAHCGSCNIDYRRDFTRNVELTFHPEPWLRPLPEGELCLLGQGSTPHVRFQAEVAAGSRKHFALTLPLGPHRFRTVEAGAEADATIGPDGMIPEVEARGSDIVLTTRRKDELVIRNDTDRPLFFVVEDRNWTMDALTGERVIAMPAFRRLCPEQLLRPGDDVAIGRVAIMFTDLQGSTKLYEDLGDATAYRLVRDHFAFLSERVQQHDGFIVKTVGDAVMAAFHDPADAVRAVLSIQDEVAKFNRGRRDARIVLKLGLHAGSCIAVTAGGVLDYFGSAVNTAARLEPQCRGGEVVVSETVLADAQAREALAGRSMTADSAMMRGLSEPVRFFRVAAAERAD
jgi:class 3 adenylate cyclase/carbon monoxide dehydrogenase subunit G